MGAGIAQVAAQAGYQTIVYDSFPQSLDKGRAQLAKGAAALLKRGKIDADEAKALEARVTWTDDIGALATCGLVIEAIIESHEIKTELFSKLEGLVSDRCYLATNTSSLSVTALATQLKRPQNFLGLHFFNPAPIMKLVEVIAGEDTDPQALQSCFKLMEKWGKKAVIAKDVPGFIVNRVARPFYAEGWQAYEDEAANAASLDYLYRELAGFRMGPLELGDLIGHDINSKAAKSIFDAYSGQTRFRPSKAQKSLAANGHLGRKSGRGVYDYGNDAPAISVQFAPPANYTHIARGPNASFASVVGGIDLDVNLPANFYKVDDCLVGFASGHSAKYLSNKYNAPVALLDYARDLNIAKTLAFSASDESATMAARAFITALDKKPIHIKDRPGAVILRTLLQLANAAADAIADDVADAAAIDKAMVYGVNYPFGPMAWAQEYGIKNVISALSAIADETGQPDLYAPSAIFQSLA